MRKRLAGLASNILNPFSVSITVIILLAFKATASTAEAIKWAALAISLSILPVFVIILCLVHRRKIEGIFIKAREQRHRIYLLASAFAVVSCIILAYAGAPPALLAAFVAGLSSILVFMGINLWWKISVHTAFAAASVTILAISYGAAGAVSAVLLPVIGWARIELEHHSPAQVIAGAVLAALTAFVVFYLFGLSPLRHV
ncbi:MAG: phosphatase PAP2 family protein [Chloroflexota bacterium]